MEVGSNLSDKGKYDYALVLRATDNGDQRAYAELMERYHDSIYYMLLKMIKNTTEAEDLTIETFGKAFKRLEQYTPKFAFSTWLFKIASNNCIDFIRKKRIKAMSLDAGISNSDGDYLEFNIKDSSLDPGETIERKERIKKMREVVESLKPKYRRLVELRYFKELSYEEISQEMEIPLGTVKAQLFRAREVLLQIMNHTKDQY